MGKYFILFIRMSVSFTLKIATFLVHGVSKASEEHQKSVLRGYYQSVVPFVFIVVSKNSITRISFAIFLKEEPSQQPQKLFASLYFSFAIKSEEGRREGELHKKWKTRNNTELQVQVKKQSGEINLSYCCDNGQRGRSGRKNVAGFINAIDVFQ